MASKASMSESSEPVWRSDIDSLAFRPSGHNGICVIHRRALRTLLGRIPSPQQGIAFYLTHRQSFEAAARAKLAASGIRETENFHLTSRDVRRRLKNSAMMTSRMEHEMKIRPDHATLTPEEFFAWVPGQDGRYELVEGEVVMMAGAGRRHDAIVVNLIAAIRPQTRGTPCQTFTGDTYVATAASTRRMPDMGVDCGQPDENALTADKPSLVVEVLSPTTGGFDLTVKLAEYQSLPSLDFILFVDTESPTVHLYRRGRDRLWQDAVLKGLDAVVELDTLNISLPLRDIYEGLQFRPKPKLVQGLDEEPDSPFKPT